MINFLQALNILSDDEINQVEKHLITRTLQKGEYFIREGKECQEVAFIKSGILRSYYTKDNGEEITYCITFSNTMMTAYSSFITGAKSPENIQAITAAELLILKKSVINELAAASTNWVKLLKFFAEQQYVELEKRIFSYQKEKAFERYVELMKNHPDYIQKIPLQYLASYLGITPRHLSRIRKELTL